MNLSVNDRIKEARKNKNYSQEQVGDFIGMKCSTYSQMERKGSISVEKALKLAEVLEADPYYIIFGKPKEELIDFSPVNPEMLAVNSPSNFIEMIKNGEDELVLTHNEKNFIKNFRHLKPKDRDDVIKYLESKINSK